MLNAAKEAAKEVVSLAWKKVDPEHLRVGEHIYAYRKYGTYSHHGIYAGDGSVIHFTRTEGKESILADYYPKSGSQSDEAPRPACSECGYQETQARGVVKTCLDCFCRGRWKLHSIHYYAYGVKEWLLPMKNAGTCTTLNATRTPEEAADAAEEMLSSKGFGKYDLQENNCEHFATYCKTGTRRSEQISFWDQFGLAEAKEGSESVIEVYGKVKVKSQTKH